MSVVILGAGGHAKVVAEPFVGLMEVRMVGKNEEIKDHHDGILIGIGDMRKRRELFEKYEKLVLNAIHENAVIGSDVSLGVGAQIMAGVVIQPGVRIGKNTIVNTSASVDHDCLIGAHCHIAPGAILCGGVTIGDRTFIGAGSVITEGVTIGSDMFVPAGLVISKNGYCKRYRQHEESPPRPCDTEPPG